MKTHLRRLLMCCLLLLILPMAAFAEENELPVEWVRYGHGLPNPASVDAHELTEEAITLEGVAYAPKLENGRVYVRLEDLAAAKLVRENGDALQTLGLAVSDLQIENGQLKAPGKEEALAQFLSTAGVGVSLNDSFTLANAGDGKLIIRIAGFAAKDSTDAAPAAGDGEVAVEAKGASHLDPYEDSAIPRPSVTTVHVYYVGATSYPVDSAAPGDNQEQPPLGRVTVSTFLIGVAYSQEDLDNGVSYYLTLDSEDPSSALSFDIRDENHTSLTPGTTYKALDAAEKTTNAAHSDTSINVAGHSEEAAKMFPTIRLSSDPDGKDIVKNIRFENKTPEGTEFVEQGDNGHTPTENPPAGYHHDPNRDKGRATAYAPDSITTVTTNPGDPTDVVIEIRDVVYVGDLKPSAW